MQTSNSLGLILKLMLVPAVLCATLLFFVDKDLHFLVYMVIAAIVIFRWKMRHVHAEQTWMQIEADYLRAVWTMSWGTLVLMPIFLLVSYEDHGWRSVWETLQMPFFYLGSWFAGFWATLIFGSLGNANSADNAGEQQWDESAPRNLDGSVATRGTSVNPANGMPMVNNSFDVSGNTFGSNDY